MNLTIRIHEDRIIKAATGDSAFDSIKTSTLIFRNEEHFNSLLNITIRHNDLDAILCVMNTIEYDADPSVLYALARRGYNSSLSSPSSSD